MLYIWEHQKSHALHLNLDRSGWNLASDATGRQAEACLLVNPPTWSGSNSWNSDWVTNVRKSRQSPVAHFAPGQCHGQDAHATSPSVKSVSSVVKTRRLRCFARATSASFAFFEVNPSPDSCPFVFKSFTLNPSSLSLRPSKIPTQGYLFSNHLR